MADAKSEKDGMRPRFGPEALPDGAPGSRSGARSSLPSPAPPGQRPLDRLTAALLAESEVSPLHRFLSSPGFLLAVALILLSLAVNNGRLSFDLSGGRLLPVPGLSEIWLDYLASWHSAAGGTTAPAPVSLAVLGIGGILFAPLGGPSAFAALLFLGDPLFAGLIAYSTTRRLPVSSVLRTLVATAYALVPAATGGLSQGRFDVIVVHIVFPLLLVRATGLVGNILSRREKSGWLAPAAIMSLLVAVVGAFSSLVYLIVLVGLLVAFIVRPSRQSELRRRVFSLGIVVFLPLGLLLPWSLIVFQHPDVFVLRELVPFGIASTPTVIGAVLLGWLLLALCARWPSAARGYFVAAGMLCLLGFGFAIVESQQGPLRPAGSMRLADSANEELARTGRSVLILAHNDDPVRQVAGRLPAFGDDDLLPSQNAATRLDAVNQDLTNPLPDTAANAVARAAAGGVLFIVMPGEDSADRLKSLARGLVTDESFTSDGRPVLRITMVSGQAVLLTAEQAQHAVSGDNPPTQASALGIVPVPVTLPDVHIQVSEGSQGRLLVLAANDDPGWQASIDGRSATVLPAWGHLAAVALPSTASEVRIDQPGQVRQLLLVLQAAFLLFALITALPRLRRGR